MSGSDYTRVRIGDHEVGILGLKEALEEIASTCQDSPEEAVAAALLDRTAKKNYIPSAARKEYAAALVKEFRKFLGKPVEDSAGSALRVLVLGPGCFQCNSLEESLMRVLSEAGIPAGVERVTDIQDIASYGLTRLPALIINDKVVAAGTVPTPRRLKQLVNEAMSGTD
jgi:hypothetical protein